MVAALAIFASACGPPTFTDTSVDQVPDANRGVLELTDAAAAPFAPVDLIVETFIESTDTHGCAVGITEGDRIMYLQGYGFRQFVPDSGTLPFTVHTRSPIGSISKPLTALAAMELVDMGQLSLDDELDEVVDPLPAGLPALYRNATLEDLLSHRSGVQSGPAWSSNDNATTPDLVTAQPGSEDEKGVVPRKAVMGLDGPDLAIVGDGIYSNLGYLLVGAMIDEVVSDPTFQGWEDDDVEAGYEAWVWTVFNSTTNDDKLPSVALNHEWREDGDLEELALDFPYNEAWAYFGWEGPAGGWTMTIGDLTRLALVIRNEDVVSANSWDEITTNRGATDRTSTYGLGLTRDARLGSLAFGHGGAILGYRAEVFWVPSSDLGVAVMCNETTNGVLGSNGLAVQVGNAWLAAEGRSTLAVDGDATDPDESLRAIALDELVKAFGEIDDGRSRAEIEKDLLHRAAELKFGDEILRAIDEGDSRGAAACYLASTTGEATCPPDPPCPPGFLAASEAINQTFGCVAACVVHEIDESASCKPGAVCPKGWVALERDTGQGVDCQPAGVCPPGWTQTQYDENGCESRCLNDSSKAGTCPDDPATQRACVPGVLPEIKCPAPSSYSRPDDS